MKNLKVGEDHVRVEDVLIAAKHRREDCVEDRFGRKVAKTIGRPLPVSDVLQAVQLVVGDVQVVGEVGDRINQHLTTNRLTRLDDELLGFVNLVTKHVHVDLHDIQYTTPSKVSLMDIRVST